MMRKNATGSGATARIEDLPRATALRRPLRLGSGATAVNTEKRVTDQMIRLARRGGSGHIATIKE